MIVAGIVSDGHQVRAFAESALTTLQKSGASASGPPPQHRDVEAETTEAFSALASHLPKELVTASASSPNGPFSPSHPLLIESLNFQASLVADAVHARDFDNTKRWNRSVAVYTGPWLGEEGGLKFAETIRSHFLAIDQAKHAVAVADNGEEGELLCDTLFSLAYGALLLLSHTKLRLFRGRRYGILGTNGSGKSTLMRQLRDGKVENFPPQSQLRCVMVEHSLQGEDGSLSIIDFVAAGKFLVLLALVRGFLTLTIRQGSRRCTSGEDPCTAAGSRVR